MASFNDGEEGENQLFAIMVLMLPGNSARRCGNYNPETFLRVFLAVEPSHKSFSTVVRAKMELFAIVAAHASWKECEKVQLSLKEVLL